MVVGWCIPGVNRWRGCRGFLFVLLALGDVSTDQSFDVALNVFQGFEVVEYIRVCVLIQVEHISAAGFRLVAVLRCVFPFFFYCFSPRFLLE